MVETNWARFERRRQSEISLLPFRLHWWIERQKYFAQSICHHIVPVLFHLVTCHCNWSPQCPLYQWSNWSLSTIDERNYWWIVMDFSEWTTIGYHLQQHGCGSIQQGHLWSGPKHRSWLFESLCLHRTLELIVFGLVCHLQCLKHYQEPEAIHQRNLHLLCGSGFYQRFHW